MSMRIKEELQSKAFGLLRYALDTQDEKTIDINGKPYRQIYLFFDDPEKANLDKNKTKQILTILQREGADLRFNVVETSNGDDCMFTQRFADQDTEGPAEAVIFSIELSEQFVADLMQDVTEKTVLTQSDAVSGPSNKAGGIIISEDILNKLRRAKEWSHISFEFLDDEDRVEIIIDGKSAGIFHFDELGFGDRRCTEVTPVSGWNKLQSLYYSEGKIIEDKKDKIHATKKDLKRHLLNIWGHIGGDPFERMGKASFKAKFRVIDKNDHRQRTKETSGYLG
jgi:hypothetical protein